MYIYNPELLEYPFLTFFISADMQVGWLTAQDIIELSITTYADQTTITTTSS